MADVQCPYCDADIEINHDDGYGYEEGCLHQQECHKCEKTFTYSTAISFDYEAFKADCLNGEPHQWKPTTTAPKEYTRMRCETCEEERSPTEEEMQQILST